MADQWQDFLRSVKRGEPNECWPWLGVLENKMGYGIIRIGGGRRTTAHRVAYELFTGQPIPEGLVVRHKCDNPPCCNPDHLELGTVQDNIADRVARRRCALGTKNGKHTHPETRRYGADNHRAQHPEEVRGEKNPRAVLTEDQVREIRRLRASGGTTLNGLAKAFGVSQPTIEAILYGRLWKDVK